MAQIISQQFVSPGKIWILNFLAGALLAYGSALTAAESAQQISRGWGDSQRGVQLAGTTSRQDI